MKMEKKNDIHWFAVTWFSVLSVDIYFKHWITLHNIVKQNIQLHFSISFWISGGFATPPPPHNLCLLV